MEKEEVLTLSEATQAQQEIVTKKMSYKEKLNFLNKFKITHRDTSINSKELLDRFAPQNLCFTIQIDKFEDKKDILFNFMDLFNNFNLEFIFDINRMNENQLKKIKTIIKQLLDQRIVFEERLIEQSIGEGISLKDKVIRYKDMYTKNPKYFYVTMRDSSIQWREKFSIIHYDKILSCIDLLIILTPDKMNQLQNEFNVETGKIYTDTYNASIEGNYLRVLIIDPAWLCDFAGPESKCIFTFKNNKLKYEELLIDFNKITEYFHLEIVVDKYKNIEERTNIDKILNVISDLSKLNTNEVNLIRMIVNNNGKTIFEIRNNKYNENGYKFLKDIMRIAIGF